MARYERLGDGVEEMLSSSGMVADMGRRARQMKDAAEAIAPMASGEYRASFEASSGVDEPPLRRAYGQLVNTADHAFVLEFGTSDTPKFATLRKSMDAAG